MLSKLRPRSIYDVMAAIACFVALGTGTAYAANTVRTGDIVDNEVFTTDVRDDHLGYGGLTHPDLGPGSVRASEISDGTLNDEDIAPPGGAFVHFEANIGIVGAHNCAVRGVTGVNARRDHLLLTPNFETANLELTYSVEYDDNQEQVIVKVCNPTGINKDDGTTRFNLLVIDAQ
jgi:hypothetical protein